MNKENTLTVVYDHTREFMQRHWDQTILKTKQPQWEGPWKFEGPLLVGDKQGCYAVEKDSQIIYIGSGVSRGGGIYEGYGIGARIGHIIVWDKSVSRTIMTRLYKPRPKWEGISGIYTIGFDMEFAYLALSLEAYLISRMTPERNAVRTSSTSNIALSADS